VGDVAGNSAGPVENSGGSAPASSPAPSGLDGAGAGAKPGPGVVASTGGLADGALPATSLFEALGGMDDGPLPGATQVDSVAPQDGSGAPSSQPPPATPAADPGQAAAQEPPKAAGETETPHLEPGEPSFDSGPQAALPWSNETIERLSDPQVQAQMLERMAENFVFSPEDINGLATDAAPVLQRFAARIAFDAGMHTLRMLQQFRESLPDVIAEYTSASKEYESHEEAFFRMWPHLRGGKYNAVIAQVSETVKAIPNIKQEDVYLAVGRSVSAMFGLSTTPAGTAQAAPSGQPQRSFVQPAPFTPAAPGARPPVNSAPNGHDNNPFLGLGLDLD
jgi:hypothetical protein